MKTLRQVGVGQTVTVKRLHGEGPVRDVSWIWESPKGYRSMYVKLHRLEILLR